MKARLLLFDIDGTLITSGGAGELALRAGLRERFGIDDDLDGIEIAGRTDSGIARKVLEKHGIAQTAENLTAFLDSYLHHLALLLPRSPGRVLPGILPLLETLKARTDVVLGLLTGNLSRGAELKLGHYGIWHYFEFGAFADDHHDRNALGRFACERATHRHGCLFAPESVYVLGDTPHDIACARAINARAIAVATGSFSQSQLMACAPDWVFEDLSDLGGVLATLGF
ncbi:MAG: HAD hydrolase-like protein [Verrucomicrobiota bacterium]